MPRLKLVLIGAGSTVFTQRLVADIILAGEAYSWELALVDIDPVTLDAVTSWWARCWRPSRPTFR